MKLPPPIRSHLKIAGIVCIAVFFISSLALAHNIKLPKVGEIFQNSDGVTIEVKNQYLSDVTQAVEQASGITISVAGHLNLYPVTADIHQPDWPSAIRQLLANYSTVEIGNNPLLKVQILDHANDVEITPLSLPDDVQGTQVQNGFVYRPVKRIKKKIWANKVIPFTQAQLKILVGDHIRSPIPKRVFHDSVYRELFNRHYISKPEALGHLPTIMPLKIEAGKMLRVLQKREAKEN